MDNKRKTQTVNEPTNISQLCQIDSVYASSRLSSRYLDGRAEHEQHLCKQLMIVEFVLEHGFASPAMGRFTTQLPTTGWVQLSGVFGMFDDSQKTYLHFYLPEEME